MNSPAHPMLDIRRIRLAAAAVSIAGWILLCCGSSRANPANRIGLERYYEGFLAKRLNACTTCHLPLVPGKTPDSLVNFPHNPFGRRLAALGDELRKEHKRAD